VSWIVVSAAPLPGRRGAVLVQIGDQFHLVITAADAANLADMLHRAAHGTPAAGRVNDLHITVSDVPDGETGHPA
jgi:hypothetical protein